MSEQTQRRGEEQLPVPEILIFRIILFINEKKVITPRENPRRRSVGLQNEARFNQLCWLNLAEPAPQAGASDFRVGV